jgi:adenine-specific DNA-methyltransferase
MATLNSKGKSFVQNHHLAVKYHQLIPKKEKSLTNKVSLNDNLIIHGDNLKALKSLLPSYAGKVKCIYIDPPYNTGNEGWKYNDNVNSPMMQEWLGKVVDKEDLTRHDKWLCMMMPRLKLLRDLLTEDGVIFISTDDNEFHRLRTLCEEIFGESNFINVFAWQSRTSKQNDTDISINHEYVIACAKNRRQEERRLKPKNSNIWFQLRSFAYLPLPLDKSKFSNPDNDTRGPWKADPFDAPNIRENLTYKIINPATKEEYLPPEGRHWRTEEPKYLELLADNRIVFGTTGESRPQLKVFYEEKKGFGEVDTSWWDGNTRGTATEATKELQKIFDANIVFNYPKPTRLIKALLKVVSREKDYIVLDSFAGTATTAQAVLDFNNEDGGNRQFIMVECEDYADDITAERVRRVIKGVPGAKDEKLKKGLGGSFSYFELGEPIEMESILEGKSLPSYIDLARYVFYTATGEEFLPEKVNEGKNFIGESRDYEVYLFYKPDMDYLKSTALTLDLAKSLGESKGKKKLVFAPAKYLDLNDTELLTKHGLKDIEYCQLPFEIYKLRD